MQEDKSRSIFCPSQQGRHQRNIVGSWGTSGWKSSPSVGCGTPSWLRPGFLWLSHMGLSETVYSPIHGNFSRTMILRTIEWCFPIISRVEGRSHPWSAGSRDFHRGGWGGSRSIRRGGSRGPWRFRRVCGEGGRGNGRPPGAGSDRNGMEIRRFVDFDLWQSDAIVGHVIVGVRDAGEVVIVAKATLWSQLHLSKFPGKKTNVTNDLIPLNDS